MNNPGTTADMSPPAIHKRLIELSQIYKLGIKIMKAKKITPQPAEKARINKKKRH